MYARDAITIQTWANKSPDNLARVIQLAIVSAHAPFHRIVTDMADAVDGSEEAQRAVLFGWKHRAFHDVWAEREAIAWNLADIRDLAGATRLPDVAWRKAAADHALAYLGGFHGLGYAKAGFALQMGLGLSGCLDVHNLRKAGCNPYIIRSRVKERVTSRTTHLRRASEYNRVVETMGGTAGLWDAWCRDMAERNPKRWDTAEQVSALHCEALGI